MSWLPKKSFSGAMLGLSHSARSKNLASLCKRGKVA